MIQNIYILLLFKQNEWTFNFILSSKIRLSLSFSPSFSLLLLLWRQFTKWWLVLQIRRLVIMYLINSESSIVPKGRRLGTKTTNANCSIQFVFKSRYRNRDSKARRSVWQNDQSESVGTHLSRNFKWLWIIFLFFTSH